MNKETITSILNEFQGNLYFDNWLRKIGDFPEEQRKQLYPFSCKKIVALKDAKNGLLMMSYGKECKGLLITIYSTYFKMHLVKGLW